MKICKIEDCEVKHYANGYCQRHYKQYQRHGKITNEKTLEKWHTCCCCILPHYAKGFCKSHYYMWKRGNLHYAMSPGSSPRYYNYVCKRYAVENRRKLAVFIALVNHRTNNMWGK